ncbi:MAG: translational GTPase TypA [Gammaproteobacteria bacterium]|nr:translational GTPase TypA [Gammaproteobacteria bacterium]MCP4090718.1 translational GTPase TypA [Gammaproteobacteria bacterium]MCP4277145.1 translational GTPase TypA [Gammaproteobacteria bacterium]MCP4832701.1 translational GTPase TypA [Gammaproteobacteria bacterium]MCP4928045.1 translational GTPase TypA [Gammaproteobacteria bacterium]
MSTVDQLRNIAIIAHVDHGKTTLVDQLLRQSGTLGERVELQERAMDSNDIERERGITILSKNTSLIWRDWRINIVDTPGHADFGGEVERVLSMVDCVLLLVDAVEGPMPQTRFVTQKAFDQGLKPLVVINKIDRDGARPDWVLDQTFDLFDRLGATDEQLDFPVVYASALDGYAGDESDVRSGDMTPLFEAIIKHVEAPQVDIAGPLQLQVSSLSYDSYMGVMGTGRVTRGRLDPNTPVAVVGADGCQRNGRVLELFGFNGLERTKLESAAAGDIIMFNGIDPLDISDTLCDRETPEALPPLTVDEPTISMTFQVNKSPFAGKEGKFLTSRQIRERLAQEIKHNVALRVEDTADPDKFRVSGRGELHLSVLIENMRREGYELAVSRPEVIRKEVDGEMHEPWELLTVDFEEDYQGAVMGRLADRKGQLIDMQPDGRGRVRIDYRIPARGLIGFRTEYLTATAGTGLIYNIFEKYDRAVPEMIGQRNNGVMVSTEQGKALAYSLFNLQERGRLFLVHGQEVYEGMLCGIHSRDNDLIVNPTKAKQLNNIRAAGNDENLVLTPPIKFSLEQALEFIDDDELVEVTPASIRLRKKTLNEGDRRRDLRLRAAATAEQ